MTRTQPIEKQINTEHYKITETKGHHKPNRQRRHHAKCGCSASTSGGYAYRDKVAKENSPKAEWQKIRFYHQSPVVKIDYGVKWRINTHGHGDKDTTRERINKELPQGFRITQTDFEVKLVLPNGDEIDIPQRFDINYLENRIEKPDGELICDYEPQTVTV